MIGWKWRKNACATPVDRVSKVHFKTNRVKVFWNVLNKITSIIFSSSSFLNNNYCINNHYSYFLFYLCYYKQMKKQYTNIRKQMTKCIKLSNVKKNPFSVFITNALIIKMTKAVQSRAVNDSLFSSIVWLTLRHTACILRSTVMHGSNIMLHIRCFSPTVPQTLI